MKIKQPVKMPKWTEPLADFSFLSSGDVASIFGVSVGSVLRCVERGTIPEPDGNTRTQGAYAHRWSVGLLRRFIAGACERLPAKPLKKPRVTRRACFSSDDLEAAIKQFAAA